MHLWLWTSEPREHRVCTYINIDPLGLEVRDKRSSSALALAAVSRGGWGIQLLPPSLLVCPSSALKACKIYWGLQNYLFICDNQQWTWPGMVAQQVLTLSSVDFIPLWQPVWGGDWGATKACQIPPGISLSENRYTLDYDKNISYKQTSSLKRCDLTTEKNTRAKIRMWLCTNKGQKSVRPHSFGSSSSSWRQR